MHNVRRSMNRFVTYSTSAQMKILICGSTTFLTNSRQTMTVSTEFENDNQLHEGWTTASGSNFDAEASRCNIK
jgi:hypothetical protein